MTQSQQNGPYVTPAHAFETGARGHESMPSGYEPPVPANTPNTQPTRWVGWVFFAGIIMLTVGCFNMIGGIVALFRSSYYLVTADDLMVRVDYTAWGWLFIIYGAVVAAAGFGVMVGKTWARVIGVILAVINALLNLTFLAAYPVWSVMVIALDVIVIYALIVHGREAAGMT